MECGLQQMSYRVDVKSMDPRQKRSQLIYFVATAIDQQMIKPEFRA